MTFMYLSDYELSDYEFVWLRNCLATKLSDYWIIYGFISNYL